MSGKKLRVGINGFGRVGRAIARINFGREVFELAAINDLNPDIHNLAYLLKYDSTYGRFQGAVSADGDALRIGDRPAIRVFAHNTVAGVPWANMGVDVVIDASWCSEQ